MFKIAQPVSLVQDLPKHGLKAGAKGVVVADFTNPREAYEVEFCDDAGRTLKQLTPEPSQIAAV